MNKILLIMIPAKRKRITMQEPIMLTVMINHHVTIVKIEIVITRPANQMTCHKAAAI